MHCKTDSFIFEFHFLLGVFHAADIPYIMGQVQMPLNPEVREDAEFGTVDFIGTNEEDREYSDFVMDMFTNYVKFGYVSEGVMY